MFDLFLNHSAIFVAGEFALGVSIVMFLAALVVTVRERHRFQRPSNLTAGGITS
jgi:hypothetical protein